jgi:hypothetical protein
VEFSAVPSCRSISLSMTAMPRREKEVGTMNTSQQQKSMFRASIYLSEWRVEQHSAASMTKNMTIDDRRMKPPSPHLVFSPACPDAQQCLGLLLRVLLRSATHAQVDMESLLSSVCRACQFLRAQKRPGRPELRRLILKAYQEDVMRNF